MILWLAALGCEEADPAEALRACTDAACQTAAVEAAYTADPAGTIAWIAAEDPVTQAALLDQLTHRFPADARTICKDGTTEELAHSRCARRNVRPHLFENPGGGKKVTPRAANAAAGPRSSTLPVPAAATWIETAPPLECGARSAELCAVDDALALAESGASAGLIAARCAGGFPDRGRGYGECLFKASEVIATHRGAGGVSDALALCSDSAFGPMCVAHLLTLASPPVPAADGFTSDDIAAAQAVVEALAASEHGATYIDRFWASWVYSSYAAAGTVTGALLTALPAEARHHVAPAAAYRLMAEKAPRSFDGALAALEERLADTATPGAPRHRQSATWQKANHWEQDRGPEAAIPTAWLFGPARRALSEDEGVDRQLAVLEAAGQLPRPPRASFFLDVLDGDHDPVVRWTAARIGASLDPEAAAQRTDDDPLVRSRLSGRSKKRPGQSQPADPPQPQPAGAGG